MPRNFADRLLDALDEVQNPSCVGLDPTLAEMPACVKDQVMLKYGIVRGTETPSEKLAAATADAIVRFNKAIIDALKSKVRVFKPQMAFYECYGPPGVVAFLETVRYAKSNGAIVIEDAKREDIGKTASFYARGHLGLVEMVDGSLRPSFDVDAITVSPYIGSDNVNEFVRVCAEHGKGAFVLAKTSNPSSGEFQDKRFCEENGGRLLYEDMALYIDRWGSALVGERGYSSLGAVVGATYPEQAARCREMMPRAIFLVPGYGTQLGTGESVMPNFNTDGYGAVINNSSAIIFAFNKEPYRGKIPPEDFAKAALEATIAMRNDIVGNMKKSGKLPQRWSA